MSSKTDRKIILTATSKFFPKTKYLPWFVPVRVTDVMITWNTKNYEYKMHLYKHKYQILINLPTTLTVGSYKKNPRILISWSNKNTSLKTQLVVRLLKNNWIWHESLYQYCYHLNDMSVSTKWVDFFPHFFVNFKSEAI